MLEHLLICLCSGAEKDLLKDAAAILQDAEKRTWDDYKRAERDPKAFRSEIYSPGTEYLLCYSSKWHSLL